WTLRYSGDTGGRSPTEWSCSPQRRRASAASATIGSGARRSPAPRAPAAPDPAPIGPALLIPLLLGLRDDADVGLRRAPALRVPLPGFLVGDRARDDHILAQLPVHRGRHLVFGGELERVDHPQDLVEVAPGGHGIDEDQFDLLVWADHEHVAHGVVVGRG